jgi:hypothetical protein
MDCETWRLQDFGRVRRWNLETGRLGDGETMGRGDLSIVTLVKMDDETGGLENENRRR